MNKRILVLGLVLSFGCSEEEPKPVIQCTADIDCDFGKLCYESKCEIQERYNCLAGGDETPKLDVSPKSLDFGQTASSTNSLSVTIQNTGGCTLSIVDASIDAFDTNRFGCSICNPDVLPISVYLHISNTSPLVSPCSFICL